MDNKKAVLDCDLIDGQSVWYLKVSGLWKVFNDFRTTGERGLIANLSLVINFTINLPLIVFQVMAFFILDVDIIKMTVLSALLIPCVHIFLRLSILFILIDGQANLVGLMRRDFLTAIPAKKQASASKIYLSYSWINTLNKIILASTVILLFVWGVCPYYSTEYILRGKGDIKAFTGGRYKITGGWYPVPMEESPYFEIIRFYETISIIWNGGFASMCVCMFFQNLMCLTSHFRVLGYHISTLKADNTHHEKDSAIYKDLGEILSDHRKLLWYTNELIRVYNPMVTATMATTMSAEIVCVFQLLFGGVSDVIYLMKFFQLMGYAAFEIAMFCVSSSELESASSDLHNAIYSSEWYKADIKYRQAAHMMMTAVKRGLRLTALKMYPINLETMLSIFQFTYTMATLMSRLQD